MQKSDFFGGKKGKMYHIERQNNATLALSMHDTANGQSLGMSIERQLSSSLGQSLVVVHFFTEFIFSILDFISD